MACSTLVARRYSNGAGTCMALPTWAPIVDQRNGGKNKTS